MDTPKIAQKQPYPMEMEPGLYKWCTCGESETQPFCDHAHRREGIFSSLKIEITEKKTVYWCGCKQSNNKPFCDGTHKKL